ncbi:MAG: ABC transporter substrate-binding protein [Caulobacterales bacterium]
MFNRRNTLAAAVALGAMAFSGAGANAAAPTEAQTFVLTNAQSTIQVMGDPKLSAAERVAKFDEAMNKIADFPAVSRFVLGRYANRFNAQQTADFQAAFREYMLTSYRTQLDRYRGTGVTLAKGYMERTATDVVVPTNIATKQSADPLPVKWRAKKGPSGWKIIDVQLWGVWLAIEQRADFETAFANGGSKPEGLIAYIKDKTAEMKAGKSASKKAGGAG